MKTNLCKLLMLLLVMLTVQYSFAQEKTVSGTVTDNDGLPLPGVNVLIKNTATGTQTDFDGKYSISADESDILTFSYLGFATQEKTIGTSDQIDVQLEPDAAVLDEVVVTALGQTRAEKSLGYSVEKVDGDVLSKTQESNLVNTLSGQATGVQITNSSGAAGASARIVLRGASSLSGNNQPLFIIDGVPLDNTANATNSGAGAFGGIDLPNGAADINPNDIETITVLKGPNAAALYGLRAANGVIVITTKKGKANIGLGVTVNTSVTFENPLVLPDFQNSYGQGASQDTFNYIDGQSGTGGVDESWGPPLDVGLEFVQWNSYTVGGAPLPWVSRPDNIKDFFNTGVTKNNNISFSGGSENTTFRLSLSDLDQDGIVPFTGIERYTLSGNGSHNFNDKITVDLNMRYIRTQSDNLQTQGYNNNNPTQQLFGFSGRNVDFAALRDWRSLPVIAEGLTGAGTPLNWNTRFQNNPFWVLETNTNPYDKKRFVGTISFSMPILKDLTLSGRSSADSWNSSLSQRQAFGTNGRTNGAFRLTTNEYLELNNELILGYEKEFDEKFSFSFNVGGNLLKRTDSRIFVDLPSLELPDLYVISNLRSGSTAANANRTREQKINSVFGFGEVSYNDYLFLSFTARNDWASILPEGNNSFFYPSVSLSAVISEMMELNPETISFLKVRGGWSEVGSVGELQPYNLQPIYEFLSTPFGETALLRYPNLLNNPDIKPETTTGYEFGAEIRFLNNKIRLNATYYDQTSSDLIVRAQVTSATGVGQIFRNIGEMNNKGIELSLGTTLYETDDVGIDLNLNFSSNENTVVTLGGDLESLQLGNGQWDADLEARPGLPYGLLVGHAFERSDDGQIVYADGIPQIATDTKILGDINPDWTGGANLTFRYKNLSFGGLVDAKIGGEVYSITNTWGRYAGILEETAVGRETGIIGQGVKDDGNGNFVPNDVVVPAKTFQQSTYNNSVAESSVFDASYIKLRQLSLTYSFQSQWLKTFKMNELSVSLIARNVALLYRKAPHIDPETGFSSENESQGFESGQVPSTRSIGFNVNLKF